MNGIIVTWRDKMKNYKPAEFALLIGVSVRTLQRWDNDGKFKARRNPANRRYYTEGDLDKYRNSCFSKSD